MSSEFHNNDLHTLTAASARPLPCEWYGDDVVCLKLQDLENASYLLADELRTIVCVTYFWVS